MAASPAVAAPPSASDDASEFAADVTVKVPPASMTTAAGIVASEFVVTTLTATAAANEIGPAEVSASGVLFPPDVEPSADSAADVRSAAPRSPWTCSVTFGWSVPASPSSPSAPAADAVADVTTVVKPDASNVTDPVASMSLVVVAV